MTAVKNAAWSAARLCEARDHHGKQDEHKAQRVENRRQRVEAPESRHQIHLSARAVWVP